MESCHHHPAPQPAQHPPIPRPQDSTIPAQSQARYDIGVDVGSISTKVLLLKDSTQIAAQKVLPTTMEPHKLAHSVINDILQEVKVPRQLIRNIVATGQGRKSITFANLARTEITAFAKGAFYLYPRAEMAVDIGGHGIRVIRLGEMGIVTDFKTNDKCSSCTGCFIGAMATALEVDIDNVGDLSLSARNPEDISTTCTIFAESEVVSLVAKGKNKEDILAGINAMTAKKIGRLINAIGSRSGAKGPVFVGGGVGLNKGMIEELRKKVNRDIYVPEHPQFVGALGAALLAPRPTAYEGYYYDEEDEQKEKPGILRRIFGGGSG